MGSAQLSNRIVAVLRKDAIVEVLCPLQLHHGIVTFEPLRQSGDSHIRLVVELVQEKAPH